MNVIDLFSGVGGFSSGFEKAGFEIILANEIDRDISLSYAKNHKNTKMLNKDIKDIIPEIQSLDKKVDVIIGGPPCQGFSMAGARIRANKDDIFLNDPRNYLFRNYFKVVKELEPEFFVMENVPGMLSMQDGNIIKEIKRLFTEKKHFKNGSYKLFIKVFNAHDYGVPQERKRLIIFGSKIDIPFERVFDNVKNEMKKSGLIYSANIFDAISDLDWLESGEGEFIQDYKLKPKTKYQRERRKKSKKLYNHVATKHNNNALSRIKELKQGDRRENLKDCNDIKSVHSGAYGRMRWDEPSKTIITRFDTPSSGVYVHPVKNRTITPREAARLQSFDDDFIFYGNKSTVIKQIGNAVPPLFAYYLANVILEIKEKYYGRI